jgi:hypothetical protein
MSKKDNEPELIKILSQRIVDAQSNLRVLDAIKWDEAIKQDFFKHKGKKLGDRAVFW